MIKFLLLSALLLATPAVAATTYELDDSGAATFKATGKPGFLRINGEGGRPVGTVVLDGTARLVSATVKVKLGDLTTGIDLRDEHMKTKYLEIAKFPEAVLVLDPSALPDGKATGELTISGKLTLHGVTKPVNVDLSLENQGSALKGEGRFEIDLDDFGVAIPKYMGVTVAETVEVLCSFRAQRLKQ